MDRIAQAASGDQRALELLLRAHYDELARFADQQLGQHLRSTIGVEDILQEAFVEAFRSIATFQDRENGSFVGWMRQIVRHRILDADKRENAQKRGGNAQRVRSGSGEESLDPLVNLVATGVLSPSSALAREEAALVLKQQIANLPVDYRDAVVMRYLKGFSVPETAEELDRTPRAVHMLCHRAIQQLRSALGSSSQYLSSNRPR